MVRFGDLLLTRLFLGVGPAGRVPPRCRREVAQRGETGQALLGRDDLLRHLDTLPDPAERWQQFGELADCWREAERRQLAGLRLLVAAVRRHLVPVWAARRCLERLLGGDGVARQPPEGEVCLDDVRRRFTMTWSRVTPAESQALADLVDWCNSGGQAQ